MLIGLFAAEAIDAVRRLQVNYPNEKVGDFSRGEFLCKNDGTLVTEHDGKPPTRLSFLDHAHNGNIGALTAEDFADALIAQLNLTKQHHGKQVVDGIKDLDLLGCEMGVNWTDSSGKLHDSIAKIVSRRLHDAGYGHIKVHALTPEYTKDPEVAHTLLTGDGTTEPFEFYGFTKEGMDIIKPALFKLQETQQAVKKARAAAEGGTPTQRQFYETLLKSALKQRDEYMVLLARHRRPPDGVLHGMDFRQALADPLNIITPPTKPQPVNNQRSGLVGGVPHAAVPQLTAFSVTKVLEKAEDTKLSIGPSSHPNSEKEQCVVTLHGGDGHQERRAKEMVIIPDNGHTAKEIEAEFDHFVKDRTKYAHEAHLYNKTLTLPAAQKDRFLDHLQAKGFISAPNSASYTEEKGLIVKVFGSHNKEEEVFVKPANGHSIKDIEQEFDNFGKSPHEAHMYTKQLALPEREGTRFLSHLQTKGFISEHKKEQNANIQAQHELKKSLPHELGLIVNLLETKEALPITLADGVALKAIEDAFFSFRDSKGQAETHRFIHGQYNWNRVLTIPASMKDEFLEHLQKHGLITNQPGNRPGLK